MYLTILNEEGKLKDTKTLGKLDNHLKKMNINTRDFEDMSNPDTKRFVSKISKLIPFSNRIISSKLPEKERQKYIEKVENLLNALKKELKEKAHTMKSRDVKKIRQRIVLMERIIIKYQSNKTTKEE